ncbi:MULTISPECIES: FAD binding domain-containing protein [unclassified Pseudomonas]|uniref:FAD binding domain-containing protein n=1 Tax=unclassified Pseudomonas TaxID=196821 RepID=UPI000C2FD674|nr:MULTISPECIES: FAD binding domain-containing protein [unclassified Pseudomonas]MCU1739557.1 FAD binding domain-containing protein [Pseudomonas sp. 20S_6.2_Bac1]
MGTFTTHPQRPAGAPRALVIGGSLGGLFAGNLLRQIGWDVDIFERSSHDLDSRGGGVVLQPEVVEAFRKLNVPLTHLEMGVRSQYRTVLYPDGRVQSKTLAPQVQTSWSLLYTTLRQAFGNERYHQGKILVDLDQPEAGRVVAVFEDGERIEADLLVAADGGNSQVRQLLWPEYQPGYAGYVAWRGLLPESRLPELPAQVLAGDFGFANAGGSHILGYLVPGEHNDIRPGQRYYNWVWYRVVEEPLIGDLMTDANGHKRDYSVPEGLLAPAWREHVWREADSLLPPAFREVVQATEQPFVQSIRDLAMPRMVDGRVVLLGDAAAIPRPHTAASTSKAAFNALELARCLSQAPDDTDRALANWEPAQIALGQRLLAQGQAMGDHLMFHRPTLHTGRR